MTALLLVVTPETIALSEEAREATTIPYSGPDTLADGIIDLLTESTTNGRSARVLLDPAVVQLRRLGDLPPVAEKDLASLISNQQDRFFRPTKAEAVISSRWSTTPEGERVAHACLVGAEVLDAIELGLETVGVPLASIEIDDQAWEGLEIITARLTARRRAGVKRAMLAGLAYCLFCWGIAGAVYAFDLRRDARWVRSELEDLQPSLNRIDAIEQRLAAFEPVAAAAARQMGTQGWALRRTSEIIRSLAPESHVLRLSSERYGPTTIEFHGPEAIAVVGALQGLDAGSPRLLSPPEPIPAEPGLETFTVVLGPPR